MHHGKYRFVIGLLLIPLGLYAVFVVSPYLQAFPIAFTDWEGLSATYSYIGFDNFVRLFHDSVFWVALRHNLFLLLCLPTIIVTMSLFFSAILNYRGGVRGAKFYKVVYFFPSVLSIAIVGVLWQFVFEPRSGLLNGFLRAVGLDGLAKLWLGDGDTALGSVMAVVVWGSVGFYVVLFTAAMAAIPKELYEAALLDGAGSVQAFFRLTLPLIWPTVQVAIAFLVIGALDQFALIKVLSIGPGGPDDATQVISLYMYTNAFTYGKFGYASAIGVTLFALNMILTILTFRLTRRERVVY
ncbi:sugar ABC transporter permease [Kribbella sandramycini]|uniref:N-acetylglucosamine transport system permease protein n=1 Tax=Kribbella sandramycini TaxID=60450 RepID=A0A7Y4NZU3_9ACTN|nr:sugar ABC transporter permease [Kribbella sandramycini]MBB6565683.1 N-acetylglucosamine transport system permease protein [Kribbella sandramycini]NOL41946.1 sugar ABC transporter permease [Kribbella sandramycini]